MDTPVWTELNEKSVICDFPYLEISTYVPIFDTIFLPPWYCSAEIFVAKKVDFSHNCATLFFALCAHYQVVVKMVCWGDF